MQWQILFHIFLKEKYFIIRQDYFISSKARYFTKNILHLLCTWKPWKRPAVCEIFATRMWIYFISQKAKLSISQFLQEIISHRTKWDISLKYVCIYYVAESQKKDIFGCLFSVIFACGKLYCCAAIFGLRLLHNFTFAKRYGMLWHLQFNYNKFI